MRYATVLLKPGDESAFHPLGAAVAEDPSISRQAFHRAELLDDGTLVVLSQLRGDRDRYREILSGSEYVIDFTISGGEDWYAYVHLEPTDAIREYWERQRASELFVEMPVAVIDDRVYRVTYAGPEEAFQEDIASLRIEGVETEILKTGTYRPDVQQLLSELTVRQREIVDIAARKGYYRDPRQATHADIAAELDCSAATVGEHLRKIEATVFGELGESV